MNPSRSYQISLNPFLIRSGIEALRLITSGDMMFQHILFHSNTSIYISAIYMKHRSLLLPLTLLTCQCNTVFSQNLEFHSVNTTPTEMPLGGIMSPPKDGQVVPSMASKAPRYRYPQIPLEVDGYAVAPHNLQLEQVHIYVRHGAFLIIKGLREPSPYMHCSRRTYAS